MTLEIPRYSDLKNTKSSCECGHLHSDGDLNHDLTNQVAKIPNIQQSFVTGTIQTSIGEIPRVTSQLTLADPWGSIKARWGVGRMDYTVDPGLYALGKPDENSPVLVTANYKMSFDRLREAMPGRQAWLLVLETKGINVWCAAGKGTFGTGELVRRIASSQLDKVVSHRRLILPQLAAPGVAAHQVKKRSGFKVIYGPIRASDLPTFIDAGFNATPEMRRKTFTLWERIVLIPVELMGAIKWTFILLLIFFILSGLGKGGFLNNIFHHGIFAVSALLSALISGAVFVPILLTPALLSLRQKPCISFLPARCMICRLKHW